MEGQAFIIYNKLERSLPEQKPSAGVLAMSFLRVKHIGQADPSENGMNETVVRSARHFITFNNIQSHPITPNNISCPIMLTCQCTLHSCGVISPDGEYCGPWEIYLCSKKCYHVSITASTTALKAQCMWELYLGAKLQRQHSSTLCIVVPKAIIDCFVLANT